MAAAKLKRGAIGVLAAIGAFALCQSANADAASDWLCAWGLGSCPPPGKIGCGSLTAVADFGANPGKLEMCVHVPSGLEPNRPLVIALHGCRQQAQDYGEGAGWTKLADEYRFALLLPQQTPANNQNRCFNWFEPKDVKRHDADGAVGEAASIWAMVQKAHADCKSDPNKIYVAGLSAGGAMAVALLAAYPEIRGGGVAAGVPYGCASDLFDAFACMNGSVKKTPQEWGDLVRAAASGRAAGQGKPKISIWQGAADTTVDPKNAEELVKEWTNVLGVGERPAKVAAVHGAAYEGYADANGTILVEKYLVPDANHGVEVDAAQGCGVAGPWILDKGICSSRLILTFWGLSPN
jgi:poly(hydroxyalkanoate) depolymerase family esterase